MDHAYTLSGAQAQIVSTNPEDKTVDEDENIDEDHELEEGQEEDHAYDQMQEHDQGEDSMEEGHDDGAEDITDQNIDDPLGDEGSQDGVVFTYKVLLPTEEWMQMLPPQYLLHYIRERTVCRESGRPARDGRDSMKPLKRGWLQGAWRETFKEAISKQTDIPCVIYFNSSNFLKQPFSRKVGPPLWRVRACCRQNDGKCLQFHLKVQDFHPSKPHVEIILEATGSLLEGPEGEERHTVTASDHMKVLKNMQRYNALQTSNGSLDGSDFTADDTLLDFDEGEVQRFEFTIPTQEWVSFLPAEAADAYVLERSQVSKDRLALESADAWSRGTRVFVPRVTKECRQYLKRALAERSGLPCRIGLTGRCHLKPPFSRKKRAPLFVTTGFCGRKDHRCLRFKFIVQDFNPRQPEVKVQVEVRGTLLEGPEGDARHNKRPTDDWDADEIRIGMKRTMAQASGVSGQSRRGRMAKRGRASGKRAASSDAYAEAVQALQSETWPGEFDLQTSEVVLDEAEQAQGSAGDQAETEPQGDFVSSDEITANAIRALSEAEASTETALGEDATRELMQLANEALTLAGGGTGADGEPTTRFTATKIVQSGDQVFIFVADPADGQDGGPPTIEAVEVNSDELTGVMNASGEVTTAPGQENLLAQLVSEAAPEEPLEEEESPYMEYRWQIHLPMADWLRLLPAKSLRFYVHERTVGREVWVEEGWEKQFRCQTLQTGWRDVIRRAVVEQTDIPCQMCFRGRSSLKLPFSRKHSAALWRTQGYCAKGDRSCLIYKFCVQDFHPDDEAVTVQVYAVGKMHKDCRRWFTGMGTIIPEQPGKEWPDCEAELDTEADTEADADVDSSEQMVKVKCEPEAEQEWETDQASDSEHDHEPAEQEEEPQREQIVEVSTTAAGSAGEEFYQAVLKNIDALKVSLSKARRCPIKMQAALRQIRSAATLAEAPCQTQDCLCRPQTVERTQTSRTPPNSAKLRGRVFRQKPSTPQEPSDDPLAEPDVEATPATPPAKAQVAASRPVQPVRLLPKTPSKPISALPTTPSTVPSVKPVTPAPKPPQWQKTVTRSGPVVVTALTPSTSEPTIIKLSPSQMAARRTPMTSAKATPSGGPDAPRASSNLVKLSSAIERSAMRTPAVIRPVVQAADTSPAPKGPLAASTPALTRSKLSKQPVSQAVVSSSQDRAEEEEVDDVAEDVAEEGDNDSWVIKEMRRVLLDTMEEASGALPGKGAPARAAAIKTEKQEPAAATTPAPKAAPAPAPKATAPAPPQGKSLRARVLVEKMDEAPPMKVTNVRSLAKPTTKPTAKPAEQADQPQTRILPPRNRPVTRGVAKGVVGKMSEPPPLVPSKGCPPPPLVPSPTCGPPPLVPISKEGSSVKTQPSTAQTTSKGSPAVVTSAKSAQTPPPQSPKTPVRTVQTRHLTAIMSDKASLPTGGKVLILRPSSLSRSSPRKPTP